MIKRHDKKAENQCLPQGVLTIRTPVAVPRFPRREMGADSRPSPPSVSPERAIAPTQTRAGPNQTGPCKQW